MRNRFMKMLVVAFVTFLCLAQGVWADTAAQIASYIKTTTGNSLNATVSGNTVTVTGTKTGVSISYDAYLEFNIDANVMVVWQATLQGTANFQGTFSSSFALVYVNGSGTFQVQSGSIENIGIESENVAIGPAIYNSSGTVTVSGGTVSAATGNAIHNSSGTVTVSGGTVSAATWTAIYNSSGTVTVSGGTVSATTGTAIYNSSGTVTVSGNAKITSANLDTYGGTIYSRYETHINGGTVENIAGGNAIICSNYGTVTVSGGIVSATTGIAISGGGGGSTVTVSGGTVSATTGTAISGSGGGSTVTVSGGTVSATTGTAISGSGVTVSGNAKITSANFDTYGGTIFGYETHINGGTVENTAGGNAIYSNLVTVSSGTVSATTGTTIYRNAPGRVTVSGGTVSATTGTAIYGIGGTVTVSGGTVSATTGIAIHNDGYCTHSDCFSAVVISGGTVSATTGIAIYDRNINNNSNYTVTVSGNAKITSANTSTISGTIFFDAINSASTSTVLKILSGTIHNTEIICPKNVIYKLADAINTVVEIAPTTISNISTDINKTYDALPSSVFATVLPSPINDATFVGQWYKDEEPFGNEIITNDPNGFATEVKDVIHSGVYSLKVGVDFCGYRSVYKQSGDISVNISKAAGTGTVAITDWIYGDNSSTPILTDGTGVASYEYKVRGADDVTYSTIVPTSIGNYTVRAMFTSDNYLTHSSTADFTINPKSVIITGMSASNKIYDGNQVTTVVGTPFIDGKINNDDITVIQGTATFANKNVETGKTVTFSDFSIGGDDAFNYTLSAQPTNVTANISAKPITIHPDDIIYNGKVYDETTEVNGLKIILTDASGIISDDKVTTSFTETELDNANAGTRTVTVSGISLGGTDAGNYTLNGITTVSKNVTVTKISQQILSINSPTTHTYGIAYTISTIGGSGTGAVNYEIISGGTGEGSISGSTLNITQVGTIILRATKAADANYNTATSTDFMLTVAQANQAVLIITNPGSKTYGEDAFQLSATGGTTDNAVTYAIVSGPATVTSDGLVTITGTGNIVVNATMAGNANYKEVNSANLTISVTKKAIEEDMFTLSSPTFTGSEVEPEITAVYNGNLVTYTTLYENNINAGIAYVYVSGTGNYSGTFLKLPFVIKKATPPTLIFPTTQEITYDPAKILSSVQLAGGSTNLGSFTWEYPNTTPTIGNSGYLARFTPTDYANANYNWYGIELTQIVQITVNKITSPAAPTISAIHTTNGENNGAITGVTSAMEYKLQGAAQYTSITGTAITGLAAGTYLVRIAGTATHEAGIDAELTINTSQMILTYTVTYDANNGTNAPETQTKIHDIELTLNSIEPTRTGYTFAHWSTQEDGSGTNYNAGAKYTTNAAITLYAQWVPITYTVTYTINSEIAEPVNPESYTIETTDFTLNNPVRTGYTFAGWTGTNGTTPQEIVSVEQGSTGSRSYTANWILITYTVTFDANGGTVTTATSTTGTGWKLASLPTPTRDGYTFNGWFTSAIGSMKVTVNTVFNSVTTIYAQWTEAILPSETYTITFNANGGSVTPASSTTDEDGKLTSLPTPTKDGYTFNGWFTATAGGTQVTASTTFSDNTTIHAQWTEITQPPETYSIVTIPANAGGSVTGNGPYNAGTNVTVIATAKDGYSFVNWTENGAPVSTSANYQFTATSDRILVANFELDENTPIISNNGTLQIQGLSKLEPVRIFNLKGNMLMSKTIMPNENISISHLPKGVYMVNIGGKMFKVVR